MIVGFTGFKGSGKDTAAAVLLQDPYNFATAKFADGIKSMLGQFYYYQGLKSPEVYSKLEGALKEEPCPMLGGQTPRWAMQSLGTEWGRDLMWQDLWVSATSNRMMDMLDKGYAGVVVTDVRFPNEVEAIKRFDGIVIRIERDQNILDMHESEKHILTLPVDHVIVNNDTKSMLAKQVREVIDGEKRRKETGARKAR